MDNWILLNNNKTNAHFFFMPPFTPSTTHKLDNFQSNQNSNPTPISELEGDITSIALFAFPLPAAVLAAALAGLPAPAAVRLPVFHALRPVSAAPDVGFRRRLVVHVELLVEGVVVQLGYLRRGIELLGHLRCTVVCRGMSGRVCAVEGVWGSAVRRGSVLRRDPYATQDD